MHHHPSKEMVEQNDEARTKKLNYHDFRTHQKPQQNSQSI